MQNHFGLLDTYMMPIFMIIALDVVITLPLTVYEGTWTTLSPLVATHHHDLACA